MKTALSLREARAERLLSIRELARAAQVAPSTVYLTENARTTPRPSVMRRIAAALGVDPHQIVEFQRTIDLARRKPERLALDADRSDIGPFGSRAGLAESWLGTRGLAEGELIGSRQR